VSWKKKLRTVLACMMLEAGVLIGVPMRPDQIEELMHQMNQPKLAHVLKEEGDAGDPPPEGDPPPD
jgi:hypothetical protein